MSITHIPTDYLVLIGSENSRADECRVLTSLQDMHRLPGSTSRSSRFFLVTPCPRHARFTLCTKHHSSSAHHHKTAHYCRSLSASCSLCVLHQRLLLLCTRQQMHWLQNVNSTQHVLLPGSRCTQPGIWLTAGKLPYKLPVHRIPPARHTTAAVHSICSMSAWHSCTTRSEMG